MIHRQTLVLDAMRSMQDMVAVSRISSYRNILTAQIGMLERLIRMILTRRIICPNLSVAMPILSRNLSE